LRDSWFARIRNLERPVLSNSRAGFIACHPPALRRSFSVIAISLKGEQRRAFGAFAKIRERYFGREFTIRSSTSA